MKKTLLILFLAISCMAFVACSSDKNNSDNVNNTETITANPDITGEAEVTKIPVAEGENPLTHYKTGDVTLGTYIGLEYTPYTVDITDTEIDAGIQYLLNNAGELTDKGPDAVAELGDVVSMDYVGKRDGVAFEGGTGSIDSLELGSNQFISDLEQGLVGKGLGEASIPCKFPEDYRSADLAGVEVVFEVNIKKISTRTVPELTDEICAQLSYGECNSVDELRSYIKGQLEDFVAEEAESNKLNQVMVAAVNNSVVNKDITALVEETKSTLQSYYDNMCLMSYGVTAQVYYMSQAGMTAEDFDEYMTTQAELSVKYRLVTSAVAEAEKLEATDAEIAEFAEMSYSLYGCNDVEEFYTLIETEQNMEGREYCRTQVLLDKANQLLIDKAVEKKE